MSCGFGAIVLLYIMMIHTRDPGLKKVNQDQLSEIRKLDFEVTEGQANLVQLSQSIDATHAADSKTRRGAVLRSSRRWRNGARRWRHRKVKRSRNEKTWRRLKADVESREEEVKRLEAKAKESEGTKARSFIGEGDRQYLTGLKIGGQHILLAIDTSASMLDDTIVNVIRRRNMSDDGEKRLSEMAPRGAHCRMARRAVSTRQSISDLCLQRKRTGNRRRYNRPVDRCGQRKRSRTGDQRRKRRHSSRRNQFVESRDRRLAAVACSGQHLSGHRRFADARQKRAERHHHHRQPARRTVPRRIETFSAENADQRDHVPARRRSDCIGRVLGSCTVESTGAYLVPSKDWP